MHCNRLAVDSVDLMELTHLVSTKIGIWDPTSRQTRWAVFHITTRSQPVSSPLLCSHYSTPSRQTGYLRKSRVLKTIDHASTTRSEGLIRPNGVTWALKCTAGSAGDDVGLSEEKALLEAIRVAVNRSTWRYYGRGDETCDLVESPGSFQILRAVNDVRLKQR